MKRSDVYLFNPTCEYAVANGNSSWQPNRILQKMEMDLATLPLFFAQSQDLILVDKHPSNEFFKQFEKIGLMLPKFVLKNEIIKTDKTINYHLGKLLPWGWSPATHKLLSPLKAYCSEEFQNLPTATWKPEFRSLYSKEFALKILKKLLPALQSDIIISKNLLPQICTKQEQFESLISRWEKLMVKAPWSSSGRGLQPITKTPIHTKVWEKLLGIVNEQGFAMVEPLLNKVADLAFQFELKQGKILFLGISNFSADKKGQYKGNFLNGIPDNYSKEITNFVNRIPEIILESLISILENSELAKYYTGYFGVDTLIFRDKNNQLKINPCLEINVRQNMGLLSLKLERLIYKNKKGIFRTFYQPGESFNTFKNKMEKEYPLKITSQKIESGFFALTDANPYTEFGAYILI